MGVRRYVAQLKTEAETEAETEMMPANALPLPQISYQGQKISLQAPWRRISMSQLVKEACGFDFEGHMAANGSVKEAEAAALASGVLSAKGKRSISEILYACFEELCETSLINPTFVVDYPLEVSPLAKPHRSKPGFCERFELFIVGREIGNAFSELTDAADQRLRFEDQVTYHLLTCIGGWEALNDSYLLSLTIYHEIHT